MRTYITVQGDMWDSIAYSQLGNEKFTDVLIDANHGHIDTFIFSSGIELVIPDVAEAVTESDLPPWRQVSG